MKYITIQILSALVLLSLAFSGNAWGTYIGTAYGKNQINDDKDSVMDLLNDKGVIQDYGEFTFLAKIETDGPNSATTDDWGDFVLNGLGKSGGWEASLVGVDYITVKGGTSFAIYSVDHLGTGGWTTEKLLNKGGNIPDLSHISFWSAKSTPTPPGGGAQVPEPATIFLLGSGLLGFFGYRKKFWKTKSSTKE